MLLHLYLKYKHFETVLPCTKHFNKIVAICFRGERLFLFRHCCTAVEVKIRNKDGGEWLRELLV